MTKESIDEMLSMAMDFKDDVDLDRDDFLEHYGRKGQKWYQHIFGDRDPRAAYFKGDSDKSKKSSSGNDSDSRKTRRLEKKEARQKAKIEKKAAKELKKEQENEAKEKEKERLRLESYEKQKREDLKDARSIYKNRDKYSKEEIARAVADYKYKQELSNLRWDQGMQAKRRVDDIVSSIETGTRLYNNFAKIYNVVSDEEHQLPIVGEKKKKKNNDSGGSSSSSS